MSETIHQIQKGGKLEIFEKPTLDVGQWYRITILDEYLNNPPDNKQWAIAHLPFPGLVQYLAGQHEPVLFAIPYTNKAGKDIIASFSALAGRETEIGTDLFGWM
jgi:hypothetical protein